MNNLIGSVDVEILSYRQKTLLLYRIGLFLKDRLILIRHVIDIFYPPIKIKLI